MKIIETKLKDLYIIEPTVHGDHRGWFYESYNKQAFEEKGLHLNFIQDNHSFSATKGTLRGLHYQLAPKAQTKLVRCTKGSIFDVAVDLRDGSPTFGVWYGIELSALNQKQLLVPKGFAHGFITLSENVEVQYKVDELYSPEHDRNIIWNDPTLAIDWPTIDTPILSAKDEKAPELASAKLNFTFTGGNK